MNNYKGYSDRELAALLKEGDRLAYTEIFERYSRLLIAHAYRILGDQGEVSDLVQDVMLKLWEKRVLLNLNLPLSGYLFTAVRNRIFNAMSHHKVVGRYAESMIAYMEGTHIYSDEQFREKELMALLEKEIGALPDKMREVFILFKMEELSYKEIADRLGISDKTAKQQVYNAVKILKTKIDSYLTLFPFI
ncbi:RNA polymerase sigma-70 factor (ECF subfamily) [Pedobacter africanus]|uniref:RNA polymerase sigma-70 factor (ECF subfamily) n=1 Tax=Pedobacter africanus TaxID=151894 RepID=A0ACC6KU38_9SPHI|nr:RNA polymerase sigma-70 factor [Pedobacter africanus]MDR6782655.1 RNA polymerase sigma-70 factor (ECF subfamily) [Pedobacter africanus]